MTSRDAVFVESVSAMLKLAQSDPERARVALVARGDQVLAALRDSMQPAAKDSVRIVALIDLYVQATFGHPRPRRKTYPAASSLSPRRGEYGPSADCRGLAPVGGYPVGPADRAGGPGSEEEA